MFLTVDSGWWRTSRYGTSEPAPTQRKVAKVRFSANVKQEVTPKCGCPQGRGRLSESAICRFVQNTNFSWNPNCSEYSGKCPTIWITENTWKCPTISTSEDHQYSSKNLNKKGKIDTTEIPQAMKRKCDQAQCLATRQHPAGKKAQSNLVAWCVVDYKDIYMHRVKMNFRVFTKWILDLLLLEIWLKFQKKNFLCFFPHQQLLLGKKLQVDAVSVKKLFSSQTCTSTRVRAVMTWMFLHVKPLASAVPTSTRNWISSRVKRQAMRQCLWKINAWSESWNHKRRLSVLWAQCAEILVFRRS